MRTPLLWSQWTVAICSTTVASLFTPPPTPLLLPLWAARLLSSNGSNCSLARRWGRLSIYSNRSVSFRSRPVLWSRIRDSRLGVVLHKRNVICFRKMLQRGSTNCWIGLIGASWHKHSIYIAMILNIRIKVLWNFGDFWLQHTFQERFALKSLEIDGTVCVWNFLFQH